MENKDFGMRLRAIRLAAGKSVQDISAHLSEMGFKAKVPTVYSWEGGNSQPTPDIFLEICNYCGVDDILAVFSDNAKKSPSTDESAPGDDLTAEAMRLWGSLRDDQKQALLPLLRSMSAEDQ